MQSEVRRDLHGRGADTVKCQLNPAFHIYGGVLQWWTWAEHTMDSPRQMWNLGLGFCNF